MNETVHGSPLGDGPYEIEAWLASIPAAERDAATRTVLATRGHETLVGWKEHHAFGIGIGKPLERFPPGTYAFYDCGEEELPEDREWFPESLEPPDYEELGLALGLDEDEMAEMSDEELAEAIEDQSREGILGADGDGFVKLAEAPSLFELLRFMVAQGELGIDPSVSPIFDQACRDECLGAEDARFLPIRDLRLRRIAMELSGVNGCMERVDDYKNACYSRGILLRRPAWEFVVGWDADPPAQDAGFCILHLREPGSDAPHATSG